MQGTAKGRRAAPVGTSRPSGEDDVERVERASSPRNRVPADGDAAKTKGGLGSGRAANRMGKGSRRPR